MKKKTEKEKIYSQKESKIKLNEMKKKERNKQTNKQRKEKKL